jgi:hypothetical protein
MVTLVSLWLPILLSAVGIFFLSFVANVILPHHRNDYVKVPNEDGVQNALQGFAIPPGDYMLPRAQGMSEMKDPAYQEKLRRGPVALMTVLPNRMVPMGPTLAQWFIYLVVVMVIAAHAAQRVFPIGAGYRDVFHLVALMVFAGLAVGFWQDSIWYKRKWSTTIKFTIDGLVYAGVAGGVFGWLWP